MTDNKGKLFQMIKSNFYLHFKIHLRIANLFFCINLEINPLHITWHDSAWIPNLNQSNVLDYFSDRTNSFYDRTCNNEIIKMQRLNPVQLKYNF